MPAGWAWVGMAAIAVKQAAAKVRLAVLVSNMTVASYVYIPHPLCLADGLARLPGSAPARAETGYEARLEDMKKSIEGDCIPLRD